MASALAVGMARNRICVNKSAARHEKVDALFVSAGGGACAAQELNGGAEGRGGYALCFEGHLAYILLLKVARLARRFVTQKSLTATSFMPLPTSWTAASHLDSLNSMRAPSLVE